MYPHLIIEKFRQFFFLFKNLQYCKYKMFTRGREEYSVTQIYTINCCVCFESSQFLMVKKCYTILQFEQYIHAIWLRIVL